LQSWSYADAITCFVHAGNPISHTIADRRPLPVNFASSVLDTEGSTYHFWWTQLYNFGTAASCAATLTPLTQTQGSLNLKGTNHWNKGTGWEVQSVVWSNANLGTNEAGVYLPLAAIMVKGDTMAVIVRGTETFSDWEAGQYAQVHGGRSECAGEFVGSDASLLALQQQLS
jgi:hypothetical protein